MTAPASDNNGRGYSREYLDSLRTRLRQYLAAKGVAITPDGTMRCRTA